MALDSVLARYGRRTVTAVTAGVTPGVTPEPAWIGACTCVTPVTSGFNDTPANDLLEPPTDPLAWRELAAAYNAHHVNCRTCCAAGQGRGLRCGTGAALWLEYQPEEKNHD